MDRKSESVNDERLRREKKEAEEQVERTRREIKKLEWLLEDAAAEEIARIEESKELERDSHKAMLLAERAGGQFERILEQLKLHHQFLERDMTARDDKFRLWFIEGRQFFKQNHFNFEEENQGVLAPPAAKEVEENQGVLVPQTMTKRMPKTSHGRRIISEAGLRMARAALPGDILKQYKRMEEYKKKNPSRTAGRNPGVRTSQFASEDIRTRDKEEKKRVEKERWLRMKLEL